MTCIFFLIFHVASGSLILVYVLFLKCFIMTWIFFLDFSGGELPNSLAFAQDHDRTFDSKQHIRYTSPRHGKLKNKISLIKFVRFNVNYRIKMRFFKTFVAVEIWQQWDNTPLFVCLSVITNIGHLQFNIYKHTLLWLASGGQALLIWKSLISTLKLHKIKNTKL